VWCVFCSSPVRKHWCIYQSQHSLSKILVHTGLVS
jgi:hypothetical protein